MLGIQWLLGKLPYWKHHHQHSSGGTYDLHQEVYRQDCSPSSQNDAKYLPNTWVVRSKDSISICSFSECCVFHLDLPYKILNLTISFTNQVEIVWKEEHIIHIKHNNNKSIVIIQVIINTSISIYLLKSQLLKKLIWYSIKILLASNHKCFCTTYTQSFNDESISLVATSKCLCCEYHLKRQ